MRGWIILLLPLTAVGIATANTIGLLTGPSCSSGSGLVISVTQQGKVAGGVRVDVYREIENGEKPYWSGATEGKGRATPSALLPGQYRVFADVGGRSATLDIVAGDFPSAPATCELKIDPLFKTKSRAVWQEKPFRLHLKRLRGVVEDQKGAPIPYVIVKALRWSSSQRDVALFQTDSKGQFDLALNDGPYIALFT